MGLSPVMEIWNVTDVWNLIEEEGEEGAEMEAGRKKNEKKRADKKRICGNQLEIVCSVCTRTKTPIARALQVCCCWMGRVFARVPFPALCIYVCNRVCFL